MRPVEAVRYAGEVLRDHPTLVWTGQDFRIEVTDAKQLVLFTVIVGGVDAPAGGRSTNPALRRRAYRESFGDQLMAGMGGTLPLGSGRTKLLARADQSADFGGSVFNFPVQKHLAQLRRGSARISFNANRS